MHGYMLAFKLIVPGILLLFFGIAGLESKELADSAWRIIIAAPILIALGVVVLFFTYRDHREAAANESKSKRHETAIPDVADDQVLKTEPPILEVTGAAYKQIAMIFQQEQFDERKYLRLRCYLNPIVPLPNHHMWFDDQPLSQEDIEAKLGEMRFVIYVRQAEMLQGSRISFRDEPNQRGFETSSPVLINNESFQRWLPQLRNEPVPQ